MSPRLAHGDRVGLVDIARRLDLNLGTPKKWKDRGLLPEPRWHVSGGPVWDWSDIAVWLEGSGRPNPYRPVERV